MIYITKVIGTLFLPMGLLWLGVAIGTILLFSFKRWKLGIIGIILFGFITLIGNKGFAKFLLRHLEEPYHKINPLKEEEEPFDAIYVLGGGVRYRADGFSFLGFTGDRAMLGARLYHTGKAKVLVAAGSNFGNGESDIGNIWESLGIPKEKIIIVKNPVNTTMEMEKFAELQKKHQWKRIGLVTSAWHLPRALRLAEKNHIHFIPLPADFRGYTANTQSSNVIPTGRGVFLVETAVWEYLGMLAGR